MNHVVVEYDAIDSLSAVILLQGNPIVAYNSINIPIFEIN